MRSEQTGDGSTVAYLGSCRGNTVRELADEIDAGEVTHMAVAYRREDGSICYRLVGREDLTYLLGLMDRVKFHMHCADTYGLGDD